MTSRRKQRIAILQMLACAALWSIAGILFKLIDWNPFAIAGFRALLAAITVGIYMLAAKRKLVMSKNVLISAFFMAATFFLLCERQQADDGGQRHRAAVHITYIYYAFLSRPLPPEIQSVGCRYGASDVRRHRRFLRRQPA